MSNALKNIKIAPTADCTAIYMVKYSDYNLSQGTPRKYNK